MRVRMTGELVRVGTDRVELSAQGGEVVHEVLVAPWSADELVGRTGETITLHTREVLESQGQGSSFVPRVLGFTSPEQRALYELLTSVKGFGPRKALRCLGAPAQEIAIAIRAGDVAFLKGLPEIGKRTSETIVLDLKEKVGGLIGPTEAGAVEARPAPASPLEAHEEQAVAALVHLGESEQQASELLRHAIASDPALREASPDAILAGALAVRS